MVHSVDNNERCRNVLFRTQHYDYIAVVSSQFSRDFSASVALSSVLIPGPEFVRSIRYQEKNNSSNAFEFIVCTTARLLTVKN